MLSLYDLSHKPRRSQGLTAVYKGRLHLNINRPPTTCSSPSEMRPKTYNKAGQKPPTKPQLTIYGDDNLDDPPASSSDEDIKANIQPTKFTKRSKSPTDMKAGNAGGGTKTSVINERGTGSSRIEKIPANSTSGSSMGKRKHPAAQEDLFRGKGRSEGENMVDIFGRVTQKKKPRSSYGSSSQSRSSQPGPIPQKAAGSPNGSFPSRSESFISHN